MLSAGVMGQTVSYTIEAHADWSGQTVFNDSDV